MDARQSHTLEALQRALSFVTTNPMPIPLESTPPGFHRKVEALRNAIAETEAHAVHQGSGQSFKFTQYRRQVRETLRYEHLQPIRTVGQVLARYTPGMPRLVNLPSKFVCEQKLLIAAKATLRDVERYQALFIDSGLPPDFLAQLQQAIIAVEQVKEGYADVQAKKVAGRRGIENGLTAGRDARQCLTAVIRRCCLADPVHGPSTLRA